MMKVTHISVLTNCPSRRNFWRTPRKSQLCLYIFCTRQNLEVQNKNVLIFFKKKKHNNANPTQWIKTPHKHQAMKTYEGSGGRAPPLFISTLHGAEQSASSPGWFNPNERAPQWPVSIGCKTLCPCYSYKHRLNVSFHDRRLTTECTHKVIWHYRCTAYTKKLIPKWDIATGRPTNTVKLFAML
jgi:hypothetical protein